MVDFNPPFANGGPKREPSGSEITNGFPCGPADQELFNWLIYATQAEIDSVISKSGLVGTNADLTQLAQAIRSQALNYRVAGGTANALTVTLDPAPDSNAAMVGMPLRVLIAANNTGAATLKVGALAALPITTLRGVALAAGDLSAGSIVEMICTGTSWVLAGHAYSEVGSFARLIMSATSGSFLVGQNERLMHVRAWGGGGGGGYSTGQSSGGAGGGGGGYFESWVPITPGTTLTYVVGAGGSAGMGGSGAGNGGTTSITGVGTATGGTGGYSGSDGSPGAQGGQGGVGTLLSGQGIALTGSSGGTSIIIAPASLVGGVGGMSPFGGSNSQQTQGNAGIAGNFPGGGGGGAANPAGTQNGGVGGSGYVIITTYGG